MGRLVVRVLCALLAQCIALDVGNVHEHHQATRAKVRVAGDGEMSTDPFARPDGYPAAWSCECDTWNGCGTDDVARETVASDYTNCPAELQSPSGCGDFLLDPRGDTCDSVLEIVECGAVDEVRFGFCPNSPEGFDYCINRATNIANKQFETVHAEPLVRTEDLDLPLKHYCLDDQIVVPDYSTVDGRRTAPTAWIHRERWPKWGVYDFIPPQRFIHAAEHGALIFLYHPCLDQVWVDRLQDYAASVPPDNGGNFRFIMSPYKELRRRIAVVTWSRVTYMDCYNERLIDEVYQRWYRKAWEDWPQIGSYNHSWVSWTYTQATLDAGCVTPTEDCPQEVDEPVCGSDGRTYPNECYWNNAKCVRPTLRVVFQGFCHDAVKAHASVWHVSFTNDN